MILRLFLLGYRFETFQDNFLTISGFGYWTKALGTGLSFYAFEEFGGRSGIDKNQKSGGEFFRKTKSVCARKIFGVAKSRRRSGRIENENLSYRYAGSLGKF